MRTRPGVVALLATVSMAVSACGVSSSSGTGALASSSGGHAHAGEPVRFLPHGIHTLARGRLPNGQRFSIRAEHYIFQGRRYLTLSVEEASGGGSGFDPVTEPGPMPFDTMFICTRRPILVCLRPPQSDVGHPDSAIARWLVLARAGYDPARPGCRWRVGLRSCNRDRNGDPRVVNRICRAGHTPARVPAPLLSTWQRRRLPDRAVLTLTIGSRGAHPPTAASPRGAANEPHGTSMTERRSNRDDGSRHTATDCAAPVRERGESSQLEQERRDQVSRSRHAASAQRPPRTWIDATAPMNRDSPAGPAAGMRKFERSAAGCPMNRDSPARCAAGMRKFEQSAARYPTRRASR
jgi:hypothetical protein